MKNYYDEKDVSESLVRLFFRNLKEDPLIQEFHVESLRASDQLSMTRYILTHYLMFIIAFFDIRISKDIKAMLSDERNTHIIELFKPRSRNTLKELLMQGIKDEKQRLILKYLDLVKFYEEIYFNSLSFMIFIFNAYMVLRHKINDKDRDTSSLLRAISLYKVSAFLMQTLFN